MKISTHSRSGLTLVEISVTAGMVGVLGLIIYSLLNIGTILGAKNTAVNTAHEQARVAMLQMVQDLHSAISLPYLIDVDVNGNVVMDATGITPALTAGDRGGTGSRNCLPAMVNGATPDYSGHGGAAGESKFCPGCAAQQYIPDARGEPAISCSDPSD